MSRIGKTPIQVPAGVEITIKGQQLTVKGPKGSLDLEVGSMITCTFDESARQLVVALKDPDNRAQSAMHGLYRSLANNMVIGVSEGYTKRLNIVGVGYRAALKGNTIDLSLGYCDPKILEIPEGITVELPQDTLVVVSGIDKQKVGQFAALIRKQRPPEPYKGKGVMYVGEVIRRKAGKSFAAEGG